MAENTKIEWAHHTFNPWEGCQKAGPGCDRCYAEARNARFNGGQAINWGPGAPRRRTSAANWHQPLKWNLQAARLGIRYRVFCASLADVFDNEVDPQWRVDLFELIRATPNLDWLLLTKRIGNAKAMIDAAISDMDIGYAIPFCAWPYPNVWIGATIVNQEELLRDGPKLAGIPARVKFWSVEPMLGDLGLVPPHLLPDWVIVGGESGPNARPMHPDWARSLRDQCQAAGVPFLFKQWGEWLPGKNDMHDIGHKVAHHQDGSWGPTKTKPTPKNYVSWDASGCMHCGDLTSKPLSFRAEAWAERVGKKSAGRLLDGRTWDEVPA